MLGQRLVLIKYIEGDRMWSVTFLDVDDLPCCNPIYYLNLGNSDVDVKGWVKLGVKPEK